MSQPQQSSLQPWIAATVAALTVVLMTGCSANVAGSGSTTTTSTTAAAAVAPKTTTTTSTTTTTKPAVAPQVFNGKGDDVLSITDPGPAAIVVFECPRCTGNTVLESNGGEGLLVNTIGAYTGKRWLNVEGSRTTELIVQARGAWTITVGPLELATLNRTSEATGTGDDVLVMMATASRGVVTYEGSGNFVVQVLSQSGPGNVDLAVNEIGAYAGTVPLQLPALIQVTASGPWMIVAGT